MAVDRAEQIDEIKATLEHVSKHPASMMYSQQYIEDVRYLLNVVETQRIEAENHEERIGRPPGC